MLSSTLPAAFPPYASRSLASDRGLCSPHMVIPLKGFPYFEQHGLLLPDLRVRLLQPLLFLSRRVAGGVASVSSSVSTRGRKHEAL